MFLKPADEILHAQHYQDLLRVVEAERRARIALGERARPRVSWASLRRMFERFIMPHRTQACCQAAPARCCPQAA